MSSHREFVEVEKTDYFRRNALVIRLKAAGDSLFISGATALQHVLRPQVQQASQAKENANQLRYLFTCGSGEPPIGI